MLTPDYLETPYWLDGLAKPSGLSDDLPSSADVLVIGSGYTGLNAALQLVRAGRHVVVVDTGDAGQGCSTRNGGQISTSIKPSLQKLKERFGLERARAIRREGVMALNWIEAFLVEEAIDCDFRRAGRFHAAHTPKHYDELANDAATASLEEGLNAFVVPKSEQRRELGTDVYHGGVVFTDHASLHPGKYHLGLLSKVLAEGADIVPYCEAYAIDRDVETFHIKTSKGVIEARDVVVATNGYTSKLTPWLQRRIIPIGSYIIATEQLAPALMDELFPTDRIASDTCRVVYYYRPSPDRTRILFGGRVSAFETDPKISGPRLHADMCRIFPELVGTRIAHSWMGSVAYSFDELAHTGTHDGLHYAMAYCGSGVSMASYLGMRMGQRVLGTREGKTAFDDLPFPTRPLYRGSPWFLPSVVAWYRWRDQREFRQSAA